MTKEYYNGILERILLKSAGKAGLRRNFTFQENNDPKHIAAINKKWILDHKINQMEWASQSPSMNVIEHLWSHIKIRVTKKRPKNMEDLKIEFREERYYTPLDFCQKLVESLPRRIAAVITANGGHTKY